RWIQIRHEHHIHLRDGSDLLAEFPRKPVGAFQGARVELMHSARRVAQRVEHGAQEIEAPQQLLGSGLRRLRVADVEAVLLCHGPSFLRGGATGATWTMATLGCGSSSVLPRRVP